MEDTHTSEDQDLSTGHRSYKRRRAEAEPSCVSLKSDASNDHPRNNFRSEHTPPAVLSSVHQKRAEAEPSCVSMKSDASMLQPITFKSGNTGPAVSSQKRRRSEAEPSCVSLKSDWSMDHPRHGFRSEHTPPALMRTISISSQKRRRAEAEPSCVSLKSDASKDYPITDFRSEHTPPVVVLRAARPMGFHQPLTIRVLSGS